MRQKNWSEDETKKLVVLFWQGLSSKGIAEQMPPRTKRGVRCRLERLRLSVEQRKAVLARLVESSPKCIAADHAEMGQLVQMTLTGDAAFVRAMLKARLSGEENITLGIVKAHGTDAISTKSFRAETYVATASCLEGL